MAGGGGKGGDSSQPSSPDPNKVAQAQSQANIGTAIAQSWLNAPNQVTPWGNIATNVVGHHTVNGQTVPTFGQTMTLSPEQQQIYEQGVQGDIALNNLGLAQVGRISDAVSQPFDLSAFGPAPTADAAARQTAYNNILARAAPQQQQDLNALESRLAAQGIGVGSEAYTNAMDNYNRGINDFRLGADTQAGNEEAQQYGLSSDAYQRAISNALLQRQEPINEYSQFMGASNAFAPPNLPSAPQTQVAPTDITGATYNSAALNNQNYANNQATNQSLWGSLAGLAGAGLGGWAMNGFAW